MKTLTTNLPAHLVLSLEVRGQAHVAGGAVEEVLPAADPTDAAAVAVELRLVLIVKQLTLVAKVLKKQTSHSHSVFFELIKYGNHIVTLKLNLFESNKLNLLSLLPYTCSEFSI